jgi:hypothetical protein
MLAMRNTTSQPLVQRRLAGTTRETRSSADEQRIQALMRQEKQKTIDEAVAAASTKDVDAKWGSGSGSPDVFAKMGIQQSDNWPQ